MAISKDKHDLYKDEYNKSYMAADYSIKRLDIVLISVSTAGIFLNVQIIQWIYEKIIKLKEDSLLLSKNLQDSLIYEINSVQRIDSNYITLNRKQQSRND